MDDPLVRDIKGAYRLTEGIVKHAREAADDMGESVKGVAEAVEQLTSILDDVIDRLIALEERFAKLEDRLP